MFDSRPDILLIVLDCARYPDIGSGKDRDPSLTNTNELIQEGLTFDHALSPASWTLPAHASLFTGLNPWEHYVFSNGSARLPDTLPTLAEKLRKSSYQTASFSANPYISPLTGLTRGFNDSFWGGFLGCSLRRGPELSKRLFNPASQQRGQPEQGLPSWKSGLSQSLALTAPRMPHLFDGINRVVAHLKKPPSDSPPRVASWIESTLTRWLQGLAKGVPAFAFINLIDAHEPYFGVGKDSPSWFEWYRSLSRYQEGRFLMKSGDPKALRASTIVHKSYTDTLRIVDGRIGDIISIFKNLRNWDNSLVIVTSDHGQAFGEESSVYHRWGYADSIFRIPLVVRFPPSTSIQGRFSDWFSSSNLFDIVTLSSNGDAEGVRRILDPNSLASLSGGSGVLSLSDRPDLMFGSERRNDLPKGAPPQAVIAHLGNEKFAVRTGDSKVLKWGADQRSSIEGNVRSESSKSTRLLERTMEISRIVRESKLNRGQAAVVSRLRGWGYS